MQSQPPAEYGAESAAICHAESTEQLSAGSPGEVTDSRPRRVLVFSRLFPSAVRPSAGVFVKERMRFVAALPNYEVRVMSPIPFAPPLRFLGPWYEYSQYASEEIVGGLPTIRPRYFDLPKVGQYVHTTMMYRAAVRAAKRLRREFDFDVIDSHFAYPSGVVAAMLGRRFGKPTVITACGSDILRFPEMPLIGSKIRWALRHSTRLISLTNELSRAMEALGADPAKISLIPNGIDCEKFRPIDKAEARRALGLPEDRPIVVSVGALRELKGMHILADAIAQVRERYPNVLCLIVGGVGPHCDDYSGVIRSRIQAHRAEDHVRLVGPQPHEQLVQWYSAADVFAHLSSQEGSCNVLLEALACGIPAVATPVGGIPEELEDPRLGILLPERSAEAAARGVGEALSRSWDRQYIRRVMEGKSWRTRAQQIAEVFETVLSQRKPCDKQ